MSFMYKILPCIDKRWQVHDPNNYGYSVEILEFLNFFVDYALLSVLRRSCKAMATSKVFPCL